MDLSHPLFTLDPYATDVHAEAERLRAAGPVVPVALPALSQRFDAELAVPAKEVEPFPSLALNGIRALPAAIRPRAGAAAGG